MDEFPVSLMNLEDFQETCTVFLQELKVNTGVTYVSDTVRILTPHSSPRQFFVCTRDRWWIETQSGSQSYIQTVQPTNYITMKDLKRALDLNFRKQIANSQFNLWMALDKLSDVVHSRL